MNDAMAQAKTCFRCGAEFSTADRERICGECRKPRNESRANAGRALTFREKQIVELVVLGNANKGIAFHLHLTEGTVKEYLNRIFRKVGVSNRTELAVWALTRGAVIEIEDHSMVAPTALNQALDRPAPGLICASRQPN